MNKQERDILLAVKETANTTQRLISEKTGHSLGVVNRSLKNLTAEGYISEGYITTKAAEEIADNSPKKAIILAAGFGMRMVPINTEVPKGLLEVKGEPLIERQIKQLLEIGIRDISIVVGFMKERYEYLMDEYGVDLIVNPDYAEKNNLHSLLLAKEKLENAYIIPCDIFCRKNPFRKEELYSWYMVTEKEDEDSSVRVNRKEELISVSDEENGNKMIGISYITKSDAKKLNVNLQRLSASSKSDELFWEEALLEGGKFMLFANLVKAEDAVEINTYEELRDLDRNSNQLHSEAINVIKEALSVRDEEIKDITVLKKGMTNRSFLFSAKGKKYIMRIPGEGTDMLINRKEEADVYNVIKDKGICDDIAYMNSENGYKITEFLNDARVCDPENEEDLVLSMRRLREFHNMGLKVSHKFDIFGQIEFYQSLWGGAPSVYKDYNKTKENVLSLKKYIDSFEIKEVLTHIDAVPDNFLFSGDEIRLIDWEYAGMQDPHVDIAMFSIYSLYNKEQIDRLIDIYFENKCPKEIRLKIYCYVAACGLLWSNWCEYKRSLGVEFGEYSLRQYRFAKDFYKIVKEEANI